jgi:2-polyprenyl-3-methyl-5-hydroxy-6-metoxy-1,4-benzoquinol methylase
MIINGCSHQGSHLKLEMPLDVKSGRATEFGTVFQCPKCGLSFVNPLPDLHQIDAHYDLPAYYTHGASHIQTVEPSLPDRIITHLAWLTDRGQRFHPSEVVDDLAPNVRALDIGCGSGKLLTEMAKIGMETVGIDPDPIARAEANKNGHAVYDGTAEALPTELASGKFDLVTMTHVLEHCVNPIKALENARSVMSEEGLLYCEVPNAGSGYFETYGQISEMLDVPRHLYFFKKRNLEDIAAQAGLEIVGWRFHGLTRHFAAGWKSWENGIYDRLVEVGVKPVCHQRSIFGDLKLITLNLFRSPQCRYDSIGFLARPSLRRVE